MNEAGKDFREKYNAVELIESIMPFDPNEEAKEIEKKQLQNFATLVDGTPNQSLIAFKDPKVEELVNYIMAAIILENQEINGTDAFPIQIYSRYKSDQSLSDKLIDWEKRGKRRYADYRLSWV